MTKLKATFAKKEDIPAGLEKFYKEVDGQFVCDGVEGQKSTADFDNVNEALRKERQEHKGTKSGLTAKTAELATSTDELSVLKKKVDEGSEETKLAHEEQVELTQLRRTNKEQETKYSELETKYTAQSTEITNGIIAKSLRETAGKHIRSDAIERVIKNSLGEFEIVDGKVLTKHDLVTNNSIDANSFFADLVSKEKYLAQDSNGGGASGGGQSTNNTALSPVEYLNSLEN